jgi:7-cyano-7-deazaguanine synthase
VNGRAPFPEVAAGQLDEENVTSGETARAVWVPNRNGVFVNVAGAFAEALGVDLVVAGFNGEEAATFPDNSAEFVSAANELFQLSTRSGVRLQSYTQSMGKADIVRRGRQIGAPISSVWSCYRGGSEHCWRCESCARLERGLREADAWEWFHAQRLLP